jgi:hypothetical protein
MTIGHPTLTSQQIEHFRCFGYVVLRGWLEPALNTMLHRETTQSIQDGYGSFFGKRTNDGGIEGHYIAMMADRTAVSQSLVADDPRFYKAASQFLDRDMLPTLSEGILYFGESAWHCDVGKHLTGVKFVTYFDPLTGDRGALRLLPGSHQQAVRRIINPYLDQYADARGEADMPRTMEDVPGVVIESNPGDIIAFDLHTWHASFGGRDRYSWTISYLPVPADESDRSVLMSYMGDDIDRSCYEYDHERYPVYREWLCNTTHNSRRAAIIDRMREIDVFRIPGADR